MSVSKTQSPPQCYSVNALSRMTGRDRRTLEKACVGIVPAAVRGKTKFYRLEDIEAALKAKTSQPLRDQKTLEEIRKLRLKNDRDEGKVVLRTDIANKLRTALGRMRQVLEQKLINEAPAAVSGLEPAQVRIKNRQILDEAMAECAALESLLT